MDTLKGDKELKKMALDYVENYNSDEDDNDVEIVEVKEKPKWDCETIISTYSNLYNRPKVLDDGFRLVSTHGKNEDRFWNMTTMTVFENHNWYHEIEIK